MTKEDARWTKLYDYLDNRFKAIDERFECNESSAAARFDRIEAILVDIYGRLEDASQEWAATKMQTGRHRVWIEQLAQKTDTTLKEV